MNDIQRIYNEMCEHGAEIRRLAAKLEKRYGIRLCSFEPLRESIWDSDGQYISDYFEMLCFCGYGELVKALGFTRDDVKSKGDRHWAVLDKRSKIAVEIATISRTAAKRFRLADRRNNQWTRALKGGELDD